MSLFCYFLFAICRSLSNFYSILQKPRARKNRGRRICCCGNRIGIGKKIRGRACKKQNKTCKVQIIPDWGTKKRRACTVQAIPEWGRKKRRAMFLHYTDEGSYHVPSLSDGDCTLQLSTARDLYLAEGPQSGIRLLGKYTEAYEGRPDASFIQGPASMNSGNEQASSIILSDNIECPASPPKAAMNTALSCTEGVQNIDQWSTIIPTDTAEGPDAPPPPAAVNSGLSCTPEIQNTSQERSIIPEEPIEGPITSPKTNGGKRKSDYHDGLLHSNMTEAQAQFSYHCTARTLPWGTANIACYCNAEETTLLFQGSDLISPHNENMCGHRDLIVDLSPEGPSCESQNDDSPLCESRHDWCGTDANLIDGNVKFASGSQDGSSLQNFQNSVSPRESEPKSLAAIDFSSAPVTPDKLTQNDILPDEQSNPFTSYLRERATLMYLQDNFPDSLRAAPSTDAASRSLGVTDVWEDQGLPPRVDSSVAIQSLSKDDLVAAEEEDAGDIVGVNHREKKEKRKKHRPKVIKEYNSTTKARAKNGEHGTDRSKLPEGRNSRRKQCRSKAATLEKQASQNLQVENSASAKPAGNVSCSVQKELVDSLEDHVAPQTRVCGWEAGATWQGQSDGAELGSELAGGQASLVQYHQYDVSIGSKNQALSAVEGLSGRSSPAISGKGKRVRVNIKALARKNKPSTTGICMDTHEKTDALTLPGIHLNGHSNGKKKSHQGSKYISGSSNSLWLASQAVQYKHGLEVQPNSSTEGNCWQDEVVGCQTVRMVESNCYGLANSAQNICSRDQPEQRLCMAPRDFIQDCQSSSNLLRTDTSALTCQPGVSSENPIDAIRQGLELLSLDEKCISSVCRTLEICPYEREDKLASGVKNHELVPYEGPFDPLKKRKIRPRVILDAETDRVWNLLMGKRDIDNKETTAGDNREQQWEVERQIFKARAEYFIALMHTVQGDRRFSQWKGSVVDSVVGAFLTQNVSDHLSSSAFISLASRFPHVEKREDAICDPDSQVSGKIVSEHATFVDTAREMAHTADQNISEHPSTYCNINLKTDCQGWDILSEKANSGESYASNLLGEEELFSRRKDSVDGRIRELVCGYPSGDREFLISIGMCNESERGKPVQNHSFSNSTASGMNAIAATTPAYLPPDYCGSSSETDAGQQANESDSRKSYSERSAEIEREICLAFETTASDPGLGISIEMDEKNECEKPNHDHLFNALFTETNVNVDSNSANLSSDHHGSCSESNSKAREQINESDPKKTCTELATEIEMQQAFIAEATDKNYRTPDYAGTAGVTGQFADREGEIRESKMNEYIVRNITPLPSLDCSYPHNINSPSEFLDASSAVSKACLQNSGSRLPEYIWDLNLSLTDPALPDLNAASIEAQPVESDIGNVVFYRKMDSDDLELCGKVQPQPNRGIGTGIKNSVDARDDIPVVSAEDIAVNTHFEPQDARLSMRTGPSHRSEVGMESLYRHFDLDPKRIPIPSSGHASGIVLADIEDCPFDFLRRSSQNDHQACNASGSQDDLLTDEGLHAASTVSSLSLQGNSMLHSKSINPQNNQMEQELQLPSGSTPHDTPVPDNLGLQGLKGRLKTGKFRSRKDIANKISGAARANIEMSQGSSKIMFDWESVRKKAQGDYGCCGVKGERDPATQDSVNWEAVRCAKLEDIAETIRERGMNNVLAGRIKAFLERLHREHGSIDLEWLKNIPPDIAKDFLLSIRGLGLKSVECIRLLALQNLAFPVDTNVGRICVRLGWVPLEPLPESLQLHLLEMYPILASIQKYLWPRLCTLDQRTLYELHYQMITFGKVFCTKSRPNCNACPMRADCKHFASAFASARLPLPAPNHEASGPIPSFSLPSCQINEHLSTQLALPPLQQQNKFASPFQFPPLQVDSNWQLQNCEPIIEVPATPEHEDIECSESAVVELSDTDPDEIPSLDLKSEDFASQIFTLFDNGIQYSDDTDTWTASKALVPLPPEAASIPLPKLKNVSRLRTEHQVYEIPDDHRLLDGLDVREEDDPCPYLLAIWGPGETLRNLGDCESCGNSHTSDKYPCEEENCNSCMHTRDVNDHTIKGTLLIPCRTAMRGSFPLNGTYFQVNEVFADHETSMHPLEVSRAWIWNLKRCTVYFGTSIPAIFKGLTTEAIQACFWKGYVCVRGFERKVRAPRPLTVRLHSSLSKKIKPRKEVTTV